MKKFEIGAVIKEGNIFVITGRTEKAVIFKEVQHYMKDNERIVKEGKAKIILFENTEAFYSGSKTIEAIDAI